MLRFLHWRSLFRRDKFEDEMADEFAFHLQARTDDLIRSGVAPPEAERRARVEFGGRQRYRAECRESHRVHLSDEMFRNIRYALRPLRIADPASVTFVESTTGTTFSFPDYKDFRDRNQTFSGLFI